MIGSKLTLVGHTYCCENCTNVMKEAGIISVEILCDDKSVHMNLEKHPHSLL